MLRTEHVSATPWQALVLLVAALLCAQLARAAEIASLFSPASAKDGTALVKRQLDQRAVLRARIVSADFSLVSSNSAKGETSLSIETFDGRTLIVDKERRDDRSASNYTWYGTVRGYAKSRVILTVVDGQMAGSIFLLDEALKAHGIYEIVPLANGVLSLQEMNQSSYQVEEPEHRPAPQLDKLLKDGGPASDAGVIDVMVVYSNQTAGAAGAGIGAQAQTAVDNTNQIYANSGITQRLRLVHVEQMNYDEHGADVFGQALTDLTGTSDGQMDNVHALRNTYGADLVSMMIENGGYCGIAWIGPSASHGFSVVNRGCAISNSTFAHELGHNMGAMHDPYQVQVGGEGNGPFTYGYGYVNLAGRFRTVMAYDSECNANGFSCTRIPYMSNPNLTYAGLPVGTQQSDPARTSNVARVLNETSATIVNFRGAVSPLAPTSTVVASSLNPATAGTSVVFTATVTGSARTGTLAFQDNGAVLPGCGGVALSAAGSGTCGTSALASGTHSIVAIYSGDVSSASSTSAALSQVINATPQSPVYQGYDDATDCNSISGWAWDQRQPNAAVSVDIFVDGALSSSVLANSFRSDLANAGLGNGSHGFTVATPANAKDGGTHSIAVRFAGTTQSLSGSPRSVACASQLPPVYQGYHDDASCQSIGGWAWDQRQPSTPISVDILVDGALSSTVLANVARPDLVNAGIGNGVHGFSAATPNSVKDGQAHVITVRFAGTSTNLSATPRSVTCAPTQTPAYNGYFDSATCQSLSGWAWDQRQPSTPISVDVLVDGVLVGSASADSFRQDLVNAGIGNGVHGFVIATPAAVKDGRAHSVSVAFPGGAGNTNNSPKGLTCGP